MPVSDNPRDYTWGKRKRNVYVWIGVGAALLIAVGVLGYVFFRGDDAPGTVTNTTTQEEEQISRRALDGVVVDPSVSNLFPWAVMIENLASTRPQSGLSDAGVVYEALAEGGITRFLAIFATEENLGDMGPVRSARPYFVDWASEYDGMYVHVGGSPQGLARISELDLRDINQFYNAGTFKYRTDKNPPHHMFTDYNKLTFTQRDKSYPEEGSYTSWLFKDDAALSERPLEAKTISIDFSAFSYQVEYSYERESNTYLRSQGGAPFFDANTDTQIAPKNVVLQFVSISNFDAQRLDITTTGSGNALVFRDGVAVEATWKKTTPTSRTIFYDLQGEEMEFNAGQTWVEVLEKERENYSYT